MVNKRHLLWLITAIANKKGLLKKKRLEVPKVMLYTELHVQKQGKMNRILSWIRWVEEWVRSHPRIHGERLYRGAVCFAPLACGRGEEEDRCAPLVSCPALSAQGVLGHCIRHPVEWESCCALSLNGHLGIKQNLSERGRPMKNTQDINQGLFLLPDCNWWQNFPNRPTFVIRTRDMQITVGNWTLLICSQHELMSKLSLFGLVLQED